MEYGLSDYGGMIADRVRMSAFSNALENVVTADSVVLDIGTGTGIFALIACRLGARRVFAIEPDPVIDVARETARANGFEGRIEFIQSISTAVTLPERASVLVCDIRGVLPFHRSIVPTIADARDRLLTSDASFIPCVDKVLAAPVAAPEFYAKRLERWDSAPYELDLGAARALAVNEWSRAELASDTLIAQPALLATLDYRSIRDPNVTAEASWTAARSAAMHGFAVWFDSDLGAGISLSNAPGQPRTIYGQAFFPLAQAAAVAEGDGISLRFSASLVGGEYLFAWETRVVDAGGMKKDHFKQSTLFAVPLSSRSIHRLLETATPSLTPDAEALSFALARLDGRRALGELSQDVRAEFPKIFPTKDDALRFVTEVAQKYSR
jgi:protein arginine N-methyltransferase 1